MPHINICNSKYYKENVGGGKNPRLSIIIVSYNTRDITHDCLKSIYNAIWRDEFEVIIVDNNSHDGSVEMIKKEFPAVKIIVNKENKFFSIANNQGAKIANGDYLLLLNSDTLVYGNNLQKMIDFFDKQKESIICIGPKILNKDGSLQSCGMPEGGSLFQHFVNLYHLNRILPLHIFCAPLRRNPDRSHRTGWVVGACMMVKRKLYEKVGGLNEELIFYGEEPEFGFRTKKLGYKTIYFSDASIIHLGGMSTNKKIRNFEKDIAEYDSLIQQTIGMRKAIKVTKMTRCALKFKRFFHPNKQFFDDRISHETKVIKYFKKKLKNI